MISLAILSNFKIFNQDSCVVVVSTGVLSHLAKPHVYDALDHKDARAGACHLLARIGEA